MYLPCTCHRIGSQTSEVRLPQKGSELRRICGADDGNRTRVFSLGSRSDTSLRVRGSLSRAVKLRKPSSQVRLDMPRFATLSDTAVTSPVGAFERIDDDSICGSRCNCSHDFTLSMRGRSRV